MIDKESISILDCTKQSIVSKRKLTRQRNLFLISLISLVCFLIICFSRSFVGELNVAVNVWAAGLQAEGLTPLANAIAYCFDTIILLAITLPIVGLLLYKGYTRNAALLVSAMFADALLLQLLKTFVISPRPINGLVLESSFSFPSGHVTSTIVFFGALAYIAWQYRQTIRSKICLSSFVAILAAIVGFNRIYLNVHWLCDVLAAPFLALFILAISIIIINYSTRWYTERQSEASSSLARPLYRAPLYLRALTLYGRAITRAHHIGQQ